MYLLDTNICIEFLAGNRQVVEQVADLGRVRAYLSAVTIAELAYGAMRSARPEYELIQITKLTYQGVVVPVDWQVAIRYGKLKAQLASRGELLEDNDLYIAATALARGLTLVTHDRGFDRISDLKTEDWLTDKEPPDGGR